MNRMASRIAGFQALFSFLAALTTLAMAPHLLLLSGRAALEGAFVASSGVLIGGALAALLTLFLLHRHRFLIRALTVGSRAVDTYELYELSDEPRRLITIWFLLSGGAALVSIPLRPSTIDFTTAVTLALLAVVICSTAALPLFMVLRAATARALELAPPEVMREVVEDAERFGRIGARVSRRVVFAVATPVVFLTVGSALIVSAHLRRADDRNREETARALARAVLEPSERRRDRSDVDAALGQATLMGFSAYLRDSSHDYNVTRSKEGFISITTPLDAGSATVSFSGSNVGVLATSTLLVALLAIAAATGLGSLLGGALGRDLREATLWITELGTEAVVSGGTRMKRSRFRVVTELGLGVERLAARFRVFARAQERAIAAREAAARMRGLFFASVSHDLKSPLNAILGFTELVRKNEDVSPGQAESLALIDRRGRELLALIETILDAARIEAGQLMLELEAVNPSALLEEAVGSARALEGGRDVQVILELGPEIASITVDRVRISRAFATFIGYALRTSEMPNVRVRAEREARAVCIVIEMPSGRFSARQIEALLDPAREPEATEHRGLALSLRLGRSIIGLHGGSVLVKQRDQGGAFEIRLPG